MPEPGLAVYVSRRPFMLVRSQAMYHDYLENVIISDPRGSLFIEGF